MSIADLMQRMADAGAPMEAILIAVRAIEDANAAVEAKRAGERDRKRRQREAAKDNAGTVTGQSRDTAGTVTDETPSPSFPPNPPNTPTPVCNNTPVREKAGQGTRLATDFEMPDDWIRWAMTERKWNRADAETEAANFTDYWHAKPGREGRKSDWPATWRNWVRNSRRATGSTQNGRAAPPAQPSLAQQILARQAAAGRA